MTRTIHAPEGLFDSRPYGFAQVAVIQTPLGAAAHVSGQVAWNARQKLADSGATGAPARVAAE
jgi:hypothetical protein